MNVIANAGEQHGRYRNQLISILLWTLIKEGFRTTTTVCFTLCCTGPHLIWCARQKLRRSNLRRVAEQEMESVDPTDVSAVELLGTKSRNEVA